MKKLMHKNDQFLKEAGGLNLNTIRCCPPSPAQYNHSLCSKKTRGFYRLYKRCDTTLKFDNNFRRHATLIIEPTVLTFSSSQRSQHNLLLDRFSVSRKGLERRIDEEGIL